MKKKGNLLSLQYFISSFLLYFFYVTYLHLHMRYDTGFKFHEGKHFYIHFHCCMLSACTNTHHMVGIKENYWMLKKMKLIGVSNLEYKITKHHSWVYGPYVQMTLGLWVWHDRGVWIAFFSLWFPKLLFGIHHTEVSELGTLSWILPL